MNIIKNPAKSRPLSQNVRRLMTRAREAPLNPAVKKIERQFSERDLAYCDMQGQVFMAALDRGLTAAEFAPVYMNSQLAGVMDYSFSCVGGLEKDDLSKLLQVPILLKAPDVIVDVVIWINNIVSSLQTDESANAAVVQACINGAQTQTATDPPPQIEPADIEALADEYEYAYLLGYIYRYECLLHDESSRMVYGAFNEAFMRETYEQMLGSGIREEALSDCASEICRRLDMLLIGKLWKETRGKDNG